MKRFYLLLASFVLVSFLSSCATSMKLADLEPLEPAYQIAPKSEIPNMEFIGFKSDSGSWGKISIEEWNHLKKRHLSNLGGKLQGAGIAIDESKAYFGIYSFQELEAYKNKKRYITFVEVEDYEWSSYESDNSMAAGMLIGLIVTAPIGFIMLASPTKTTIHFKFTANIYVYDSVTKKIIYNSSSDPISINRTDKIKGSWYKTITKSPEEGLKIRDYYGLLLTNAVLEKYEPLSKFLENQE